MFVAASLIRLDVACQLFVKMPVRDVGSWNAMISGFCQNGNAAEALDVLNSMKVEGLKIDTITVSIVLTETMGRLQVTTQPASSIWCCVPHALRQEQRKYGKLIVYFYSFGAQVIALKWTPIMIIVITSVALLWASLVLADDFIISSW